MTKVPLTPFSIKGVSVDSVEDYTYLDNKLDWVKNTNAPYRKGHV